MNNTRLGTHDRRDSAFHFTVKKNQTLHCKRKKELKKKQNKPHKKPTKNQQIKTHTHKILFKKNPQTNQKPPHKTTEKLN